VLRLRHERRRPEGRTARSWAAQSRHTIPVAQSRPDRAADRLPSTGAEPALGPAGCLSDARRTGHLRERGARGLSRHGGSGVAPVCGAALRLAGLRPFQGGGHRGGRAASAQASRGRRPSPQGAGADAHRGDPGGGAGGGAARRGRRRPSSGRGRRQRRSRQAPCVAARPRPVPERRAARGRDGIGLLRALIEEQIRAGGPTESWLEDRLVEFLRAQKCPDARRWYWVQLPGGRVRLDLAWPELKANVEADGRLWHTSPSDRRRDAARDAQLEAAGWIVVRVTWLQLVENPAEVASRILAALGRAADALAA